MERREAPGLPRKRPARHGTPTPSKPWVPEARRVRPADRKAGLREPIARLPGRLPALHPSPMERGGKQGDGRTWASEKQSPGIAERWLNDDTPRHSGARAKASEPGIHNPESWLWIPDRRWRGVRNDGRGNGAW